jgi:hypothetical protein
MLSAVDQVVVAEIPNPKYQIPNKFQISNSKRQTCRVSKVGWRLFPFLGRGWRRFVLNLAIGICLGFGAWNLRFGVTIRPG